jgi:hypothetical protein
MSDEMIQVRSAIPGYAGFADVTARRLTDQQVRAWVGERLALVGERIPLGDAADAFEDAIVHCQFGDQHVIKALENEAFAAPDRAAALEADDGRLLTAASGADAVTSTDVAAFVAGVRDALARRNAAILGSDSKR